MSGDKTFSIPWLHDVSIDIRSVKIWTKLLWFLSLTKISGPFSQRDRRNSFQEHLIEMEPSCFWNSSSTEQLMNQQSAAAGSGQSCSFSKITFFFPKFAAAISAPRTKSVSAPPVCSIDCRSWAETRAPRAARKLRKRALFEKKCLRDAKYSSNLVQCLKQNLTNDPNLINQSFLLKEGKKRDNKTLVIVALHFSLALIQATKALTAYTSLHHTKYKGKFTFMFGHFGQV